MKVFDTKETEATLKSIAGWAYESPNIAATFKLKDFVAAMKFVNHVADVANKYDHHPDILIQYNTVKLSVHTHSAGGVTQKDFDLAQAINKVPR